MTTRRQTLEQQRAKQAWEHISSVREEERSDYKTRARDLPAMIQLNGLGSAMAFLLSKPKKGAYKRIYQHLSDWVTKQMAYQGDLMRLIRDEDMGLYRRATTEAIEYGIWLKRYVESWEDVEESND